MMKKELLIKAALSTFLKKGYHQTRIEDIIGAAGVGKGTFYLYFKNKEEVVHTMLDEFFHHFDQIHFWISSHLSDTKDIKKLFEEEGHILMNLLTENKRLGLFILREARSISESHNKRISDFFDLQTSQAEKSYQMAKEMGLIKNVDPKYAAISIVGGIFYLYSHWLEGKNQDSVEEILTKTLNFYFSALLKGDAE